LGGLIMSKIIMSLFICTLAIFSIFSICEQNKEIEYKETNYVGLVKLGLAPSAYPREVTKYDIDTGVRLNSNNGEQYALISSRTFSTGDFGQTFSRRIA